MTALAQVAESAEVKWRVTELDRELKKNEL